MTRILEDKIALVSGGAQGLGEAICHRLAAEGAHVIVADLNIEGAQQVAADIVANTDRRSMAVKVNITHEADVEAAVQLALDEFGRLDIAVSNAGILIADYLLIRRTELNVDALFRREGEYSYSNGWNPLAIVAVIEACDRLCRTRTDLDAIRELAEQVLAKAKALQES